MDTIPLQTEGMPADQIEQLAHRPRGKNFRWVIIGIISMLVVANYMDRGNMAVAAPLIMKELNISPSVMGVIMSAFVWPYALMNLPTGWLVDRLGEKVILAFAAGLWSLTSACTGLASTIREFVFIRICLGISEAPLFPSALRATYSWFPAQERAGAISIYIAATQVGLAIAPPIATALMVAFGWKAMFVIVGCLGFIGLAGWIVLYRRPEHSRWVSSAELHYIFQSRETKSSTPAKKADATIGEWFQLFAHVPTWIMVVGGFCLQYTFWFYISWLPAYLERAQHVTVTRAGYLAALPYIAGACGVLIGGKFSDILIFRGMSSFSARRAVVAGGALLTALAMVITRFSPNATFAVTMLTIGMFTYSLSSGCYWALAPEMVKTPRFVASIGSIQNFGGFLGGAFAPIATGFIVEYFGGFNVAILVTGFLALVSFVMYGLLLRKKIPL